MASYWSLAFGTALLVSAGWFVRQRPAPRATVSRITSSYNDDIQWL